MQNPTAKYSGCLNLYLKKAVPFFWEGLSWDTKLGGGFFSMFHFHPDI